MSLITHLRHVDLAVPDFATQLRFYTEIWGLTQVAGDTGIAFLAAEGSPEQYAVRLRRDPGKRVDLVAFGAATPSDVDTLAAALAGAGVPLVAEPAALSTPGGGYGFRFFDSDGRTVEVSSGVAARTHRRIEEREAIPVRLSHVVMNSPDPLRTRQFYERHLGFRLSDTLHSQHLGDLMYFLRCNPLHHSFAVARGPHVSLHHASFEMRGLDEYLRGTGRAMRAGTRKVWGPGRHKAGDNTFTYFLDPHGNTVEYTTELEVLDEDVWHPHLYDVDDPTTQDQWGTADPMSELIAKESFNDPDPGLFRAPPV
ncbi:MAG TPA: VOC family protein [Rugosimonospora sp.]|nr:VOC family protein [Rugosimonospora sp.]